MATLFDPIQFRGLTIPNRVWMSPMCMYSADSGDPADPLGAGAGRPTGFHVGHYGARAAGGVGLVMVEATSVTAAGRITPGDLGLWEDAQVPDFARVVASIRAGGAVPGVQIGHAGRKASTEKPWLGDRALGADAGGWSPVVGPSPLAFPGMPVPHELTRAEIADTVVAFAEAARRADAAGFDVIEIHAAHGYLLHTFLSPISNRRTDDYGGSLENRARIVGEVIEAVRAVWPADKPVFLRISTTDWVQENPDDDRESWTVDQSVQLAQWAAEWGVDLVDASSGGLDIVPIPRDREYQSARAAIVRERAGVPVAAVGRISDPRFAAELVGSGRVDAVFLGRALLRDPSWANAAAVELGAKARYLEQYAWAL